MTARLWRSRERFVQVCPLLDFGLDPVTGTLDPDPLLTEQESPGQSVIDSAAWQYLASDINTPVRLRTQTQLDTSIIHE